jgi:tryptophan synthase alpha chain
MNPTTGPDRLANSIRAAATAGPALIPYITAGFPTRSGFAGLLEELAPHAAAIEVGVPFTDPMADGVTIQRASRIALEQGVTLPWILDEIASARVQIPIVLMGYLNPFLSFGMDRLAGTCGSAGVDGLIIPDLPLEESPPIRAALRSCGVGLVQLVSPVTPPPRASAIAAATDGYLYAVTVTGVTGGGAAPAGTPGGDHREMLAYLDRLRAISPAPVCAGFGIRTRQQVQMLAGHADGVIVGSALIELLARGESPRAFLKSLSS